jgi:hypothetical protein
MASEVILEKEKGEHLSGSAHLGSQAHSSPLISVAVTGGSATASHWRFSEYGTSDPAITAPGSTNTPRQTVQVPPGGSAEFSVHSTVPVAPGTEVVDMHELVDDTSSIPTGRVTVTLTKSPVPPAAGAGTNVAPLFVNVKQYP